MDPLIALRDRTGSTRVAILAILHEDPGTTLSAIGKRLQVSVQAVSVHVRRMLEEGALRPTEAGHQVTSQGLQEVHETVRLLQRAVQGLSERLAVIHCASAVALQDVEAGQRVGLVMHDGDLAAGASSPSMGRARASACAGEEVVVDGLEGIVPLRIGSVDVRVLPGPEEGGVPPAWSCTLADHDRVAALGTGAAIAARRLGRLELEFAAAEAAFNAAERGLSVLFLVTRDRLHEALASFARANRSTLQSVPVRILDEPVSGA